MIEFKIGRWEVYLFDLSHTGWWTWKPEGYSPYFDLWSFGWLLHIRRATDLQLECVALYFTHLTEMESEE